MSNNINAQNEQMQPLIYQIRIEGHLGPHRADWFEDLTIQLTDNGETLLTGPVVDQATLHGLLRKVRDLGISLISVNRVVSAQAEVPDIKP